MRRNQEQDQEVWRKLEANGWWVIIVWECEWEKSLSDKVAHISVEIKANGALLEKPIESGHLGTEGLVYAGLSKNLLRLQLSSIIIKKKHTKE